MPAAPAAQHLSSSAFSSNNIRLAYDAHPRIYLSPRVDGDRTTTAGSPRPENKTANMVSYRMRLVSTSLHPETNTHQDILDKTYRVATSKTAQRTLLNTILLSSASAFLYALAAIAYILFYNAYLPDQVTTLPIHLQYNYGPNPYGVAPLPNIKDYQAYDISVTLTLPRSPTNLDRGNFMIALYILDRPGTAAPPAPDTTGHNQQLTTPVSLFPTPDPAAYLSTRRILHTSLRSALLPYTDPIISLASRLLFLPSHIFFPSSSRASTTTLSIPLVEKLSFPSSKGARATPSSLFLELQSGQDLRVSSARVTITAQLSGVRWLMHTYRVSAFVAGTAAFWGCEVAFMGLAWAVLSTVLSGTGKEHDHGYKKIGDGKSERKRIDEGDMSDTERTFPSVGRGPPLKYESVKEESEGETKMVEVPVGPGGEADDEDEDGGEWRDSGIGTSYSDAGTGSVRKRASGKGL